MEPVLQDVMQHEQPFMGNTELCRKYEAQEKAIRDEQARIQTYREEGYQEGHEEGREEERKAHIQDIQYKLQHMITVKHMTLEEAMDMMGMCEAEKKEYRKLWALK